MPAPPDQSGQIDQRQSPQDADRDMVEAAQRDPARFAQLYDVNFHRVWAYIARRIADRATAEDLTSQVFQDALANLRRFEWRGVPFSAWLLKIAANHINDHWAKQASRPDRPSAAIGASGHQETGQPSPEPGGDDSIDRYVAVFQLVDRLPDIQRYVIELRFVQQKSIRETAEALDRSEGAVKQLQQRAIEALREAWYAQPEGKEGPR